MTEEWGVNTSQDRMDVTDVTGDRSGSYVPSIASKDERVGERRNGTEKRVLMVKNKTTESVERPYPGVMDLPGREQKRKPMSLEPLERA